VWRENSVVVPYTTLVKLLWQRLDARDAVVVNGCQAESVSLQESESWSTTGERCRGGDLRCPICERTILLNRIFGMNQFNERLTNLNWIRYSAVLQCHDKSGFTFNYQYLTCNHLKIIVNTWDKWKWVYKTVFIITGFFKSCNHKVCYLLKAIRIDFEGGPDSSPHLDRFFRIHIGILEFIFLN